MEPSGRLLLDKDRLSITIDRICHQLIENYDDFKDTCLIGIQTGGVPLAERINKRLREDLGVSHLDYGKLDITFYRDDFRRRTRPLEASRTEMNFLVEDKKVILVDDVLYTGRTIQAALTALNHFGRPRSVELVVMVDRRFNRKLPIRPNYAGIRVDALDQAYVQVEWREQTGGDDRILLFAEKKDQ